MARRALGPGSGFLPKKGKAVKKCEVATGWRAARAHSCAGSRGHHRRSRCCRSPELGAPSRQVRLPALRGAMVSKVLQIASPNPTPPGPRVHGVGEAPKAPQLPSTGSGRLRDRRDRAPRGRVGGAPFAPRAPHRSPQPVPACGRRRTLAEGRRFPVRFPAGGWESQGRRDVFDYRLFLIKSRNSAILTAFKKGEKSRKNAADPADGHASFSAIARVFQRGCGGFIPTSLKWGRPGIL